jgi:hypothetical protein
MVNGHIYPEVGLSIGIGPFRASDLAPPHLFKLRKRSVSSRLIFLAFAGYLFAPALADLLKTPDA